VVKECAERALKAVETHKQTSMKLENIHELTSEELKEVRKAQLKNTEKTPDKSTENHATTEGNVRTILNQGSCRSLNSLKSAGI
jgi:hypothetical protein